LATFLAEGGKDVPTFVQPFFTLPPLQRREFCFIIKLYFCVKGVPHGKTKKPKTALCPAGADDIFDLVAADVGEADGGAHMDAVDHPTEPWVPIEAIQQPARR